jgi:hypothetical protein
MMNRHFQPEAEDLYSLITEISFQLSIIDVFVYEERIEFLEEIENPEVFEQSEEEFVTEVASPQQPFRKPTLALVTAQVGVLKSPWEFTIGDPDPFPSVPHGHLQSNIKIKLDSYLGYTYDTSSCNQMLKRESRQFIITLWNSQKYRDFAIKQINWFMQQNPAFVWRVKQPFRIPVRRGKH